MLAKKDSKHQLEALGEFFFFEPDERVLVVCFVRSRVLSCGEIHRFLFIYLLAVGDEWTVIYRPRDIGGLEFKKREVR